MGGLQADHKLCTQWGGLTVPSLVSVPLLSLVLASPATPGASFMLVYMSAGGPAEQSGVVAATGKADFHPAPGSFLPLWLRSRKE